MRTCPRCNLSIDNDSAKFCRKCGTKLPDIQPIESYGPEIVAEPEQEFYQAPDYSNDIIELQTEEYNEVESQSQSDSISFDVEATNDTIQKESLDQQEIVNISPVEDINNNLAEEQNYISVEPTNDQPAEVGAPIDTTEQNVEVSQYTPPTIDYAKAWKIIIACSISLLLGLVLWMLELSI
ncbi:MAG: zinc ribbon domain-containing protein [Alistipes sp.]|nr:zinc ribbon domain-containing protein [Alistipes sp.]